MLPLLMTTILTLVPVSRRGFVMGNVSIAISVAPACQEPNTMVSVLQKGYSIADLILRPALVTVTAPK